LGKIFSKRRARSGSVIVVFDLATVFLNISIDERLETWIGSLARKDVSSS